MDSAPRKFILHVTEVDVRLNNGEGFDHVEIVFHGNVTPAMRKRLQGAILEEAALNRAPEMAVKKLL